MVRFKVEDNCNRMKIIGLTGGIGVGKSTVSEFLKKEGYYIIDADLISHEITKKGSDTLNLLSDKFGEEIILSDGSLDRKALAEKVFSNNEKKRDLEEIVTAQVIKKIKDKIDNLRESRLYDIIFLDAPLLFETGADSLTDMVWLIVADKDTRLERVQKRDNCSKDQILRRIDNQMSQEEKEILSQEIIDNSKGKEQLYSQIKLLLKKYVK